MKIVVAPQAFKGTLSAFDAAKAMRKGIKHAFPEAEILLLPVADGGDGTLDVLLNRNKGEIRTIHAAGALGNKKSVNYAFFKTGNIAVIELARICGLAQLSISRRNPLKATTYGMGEAIRAAINQGVRNFIIALGGSASTDGGTGLVRALGAKFIDRHGKELPLGGGALIRLDDIDMTGWDPRLEECSFLVACDVKNPLLGPKGAARSYAPQKGASPRVVERLEDSLRHYAFVLKKTFGIDVSNIPYGGSAGGSAAGLHVFLNAKLTSGIDMILENIDFEKHLQNADLVITGEGRLDGQVLFQKAPFGVAKAAKALGIPVLAIVGSLGRGYENALKTGIEAIVPISFDEDAAVPSPEKAAGLLAAAAEQAMRCLSALERNKPQR